MYDLLLKNATCLSMDSNLSQYRWIAIKDGKIAELGHEENPSLQAKTTLNLKGKTVLPGFIDSHLHGSLTGLSLTSIDLRGADSIDTILSILRDSCQEKAPGELVIGTNISAEAVKEKRLPHRLELDQISKDHPILLHHVTMHGCVVNTAAYDLSGLNTCMDGIETYPDGSANGIVSDDNAYYEGVGAIMKNLSPDAIKGFITSFTSTLPSVGVTTVHSLDGQDLPMDETVWFQMQGEHPVHVVNYLETLNVQKAKSYGYPRVGGCIALDGSRVMKTMAINEPYINYPGRGSLYYTDDVIYNFMSEAHKNDMQFSLHVGGERAIDQFIYNLYRVEKEQGFKDLRHRPEHFSMPSDRALELAVEMQLALPMQPVFPALWDNPEDSLYVRNLGKERAMRMEPFVKIIKQGGIICGGSDSPITACNPLWGIHCAVNEPNDFRAVSVTEALKMFTINGAWAAHEEKIKGSIEKGKLADLVVLDKNPYQNERQIKDINIEMTILEGKIIFRKNPK